MQNTCGRAGREKNKNKKNLHNIEGKYGQKTFQGASRDGDTACFSIG